MKKGLISLGWGVVGAFQLLIGISLFFVLFPINIFLLIIPFMVCVFGFFTIFCEVQRLWAD